MQPGLWLRVEGLALGLGGAGGYFSVGGDQLVFLLLVIAPDASMAGYLVSNRVGSVTYNVVHALVLPVGLLAWGMLAGHWFATAAGLAWIAHVGADRTFGLGLKYADGEFRDTTSSACERSRATPRPRTGTTVSGPLCTDGPCPHP